VTLFNYVRQPVHFPFQCGNLREDAVSFGFGSEVGERRVRQDAAQKLRHAIGPLLAADPLQSFILVLGNADTHDTIALDEAHLEFSPVTRAPPTCIRTDLPRLRGVNENWNVDMLRRGYEGCLAVVSAAPCPGRAEWMTIQRRGVPKVEYKTISPATDIS